VFTEYKEFEKLINFKQAYNFNNEKLMATMDRDLYKPLAFKHALEILYLMVVKISAYSSIQEYLEQTKFINSYSHTTLL
jgi:hypothetical protein